MNSASSAGRASQSSAPRLVPSPDRPRPPASGGRPGRLPATRTRSAAAPTPTRSACAASSRSASRPNAPSRRRTHRPPHRTSDRRARSDRVARRPPGHVSGRGCPPPSSAATSARRRCTKCRASSGGLRLAQCRKAEEPEVGPQQTQQRLEGGLDPAVGRRAQQDQVALGLLRARRAARRAAVVGRWPGRPAAGPRRAPRPPAPGRGNAAGTRRDSGRP